MKGEVYVYLSQKILVTFAQDAFIEVLAYYLHIGKDKFEKLTMICVD